MNHLKELREKAGITQDALAQSVGVDRSAISHWESGECFPRADKLPAVACALGCGINDLFAKDGKEVEG